MSLLLTSAIESIANAVIILIVCMCIGMCILLCVLPCLSILYIYVSSQPRMAEAAWLIILLWWWMGSKCCRSASCLCVDRLDQSHQWVQWTLDVHCVWDGCNFILMFHYYCCFIILYLTFAFSIRVCVAILIFPLVAKIDLELVEDWSRYIYWYWF